ncbi:MAG: ATP-binding protein [Eubacteriales bacterium]|nr:ATP-binding protein [Eubacteriales bacterium]
MEQPSIGRAVAREYDRRRQQTEQARLHRRADVYGRYPQVAELDRKIAAAGAEQLLELLTTHSGATPAQHLRQALQVERTALLGQLNVPIDFDQIRPVCPICRDTGIDQGHPCSCYRKILTPLLTAQANLRNLDGLTFARFDETLFSDQQNPTQYKVDRSPRAQILAIRQICEAYVQRFDSIEQRNLLFVGPPGTGKTYLMACMANILLDQGRSVLYVTAPLLFEIMSNYRTLLASYHPDEARLEQATALHDLVHHAEMLLIDDLGTEHSAAGRYADLLNIIDHRAGSGLHTVISSNADPVALRDAYDERLTSRLLGNFAIYRFFGSDVRLELNRRRRG